MLIMNKVEVEREEQDTECYSDGVTLQPFLHQVAGRAIMMCLNETTVCKPLNFREYDFYQSLPTDIRQYTPQYKGVVNVNIEETHDGTIALTAFPPSEEQENSRKDACDRPTAKSKDETTDACKRVRSQLHTNCERGQHSRKRIRLKRTGSLCFDGPEDEINKSVNHRLNPWTVKVYKEGLKRHLHSKNKVVQKCILLENVTSRFRFPCILDLKMGTRLHGDFDDDAKRKRHLVKCATTTTQSLGVRLSGMQTYRHESGTFLRRNKYFGRGLTDDGFRKTLEEFFHNGCRTRKDLIQRVIESLRSLTKKLNKLPSYRFYSSSLLIMYDGAQSDVKAKHSTPSEDLNNNVESDSAESSEEDPSDCVDIRMIDFAKSTHQHMDEEVVHSGPDKGYIFGLENLIQVLSRVLSDQSQ